MKKERLFYLDFVRAVAVAAIVLIHYNAVFLFRNPPLPEKLVLTAYVGNLYLGDWGVSLFFIISGAALMYTYGDKCETKTFYKKRFLSLYPMFWMAYGIGFLYTLAVNPVLFGGMIPRKRLVFSFVGFDGILAANGFTTFSLVGEWFLGAIILMYLLFPLLRKLLEGRPVYLLTVVVILYGAGFLLSSQGPHPILAATNVLLRIPEFLFGMCFVKYRCKAGGKAALAALAVFLADWVIKPNELFKIWFQKFPVLSVVQTAYVGVAWFLMLVYLSHFVEKEAVRKCCNVLSKYSYPVFLIHHVIILQIMARIDLDRLPVWRSYMMFLAVCVIIGAAAWGLYRLHSLIMGQIGRLIGKKGQTAK